MGVPGWSLGHTSMRDGPALWEHYSSDFLEIQVVQQQLHNYLREAMEGDGMQQTLNKEGLHGPQK